MIKRLLTLLLLCTASTWGQATAERPSLVTSNRVYKIATAETCNSAVKGGIYYDTDDNTIYFCNGTSWTSLATVGLDLSGITDTAVLFDNSGTLGGFGTWSGSNLAITGTLSGITNVIYTAPTADQTIQPTADKTFIVKQANVANTVNIFEVQLKDATKAFYITSAGVWSSDITGPLALEGSVGVCSVAAAAKLKLCASSTGNRWVASYDGGANSNIALASDNLSVFAATTSAQLLGVLSDETGTGLAVFGTSPTFTTGITVPVITSTQGTITTSQPFVTHTATWNGAAVAFEGYTQNITVTAAQDSLEPPSTSTGSDYWNLKVASVKRWAFQYDATAAFNSALVHWNAGGTASLRICEWSGGTCIVRVFGGALSNGGLILQADPGSTAAAGAQAIRLGLVANGVTNVVGSLGGDSDGSGNIFTWVNRSVDTDPRVCIQLSTSDCVAATGMGDFFVQDNVAASSTQMTIGLGPTQGTVPVFRVVNNAKTLDLMSISAVGRIHAGGNAVVAGDIAESAGWGTTVSDAITLATSRDQAMVFTVTSSGTGQGANPTITLTFGDGTWTSIPVCMIQQSGGTGALADVTRSSSSATAYVWIWNATPVDTLTYEFTVICLGT